MAGLPDDYTVEVQFDGTNWDDITAYVSKTEGLSYTHGRNDEQPDASPSSLTVTLQNTDGRFTPGNAGSPYYPDVTDGAAIRVRYDGEDQFTGYLAELPVAWADASATHATATWTATDIFERVSSRAGNLRPFDVEEALYDNPLTLLPLDDPAESTQAGNLGSVAGAAEIVQRGSSGAYSFGEGTGPPFDGTSSLILNPLNTTNGYYLRVPTNLPWGWDAMTVEGFINSTTASGTLVDLSNKATGNLYLGYNMTVSIDAAKKLSWASDGSLTVTSPSIIADGGTHHFAVTYEHTGTNHVVTMYVDGAAVNSGSVASTWVLVYATWAFIGGGPKLNLLNGTINHVAVYPEVLSADRIQAHSNAGLTGFGGERSDQRISRIAAYAGLESLTAASLTGVWVLDAAATSTLDTSTVLAGADLTLEVGSATVYGQSNGGQNYLAAMRDAALTEGGLVFVSPDGKIQFQARDHRYNAEPVAILNADEIAPDLQPVYDPNGTVNDVTVTTEDGAVARVTDEASIARRGVYDQQLTLLTRDVNDAYARASWTISRYGTPQVRYRTVTVHLHGLDPARAAELLAVRVGDRILLTGLPAQAPSSTADLFIEGYTVSASANGWDLSWNTSSAAGFQVWQLDHPTRSVLGTTTILAY